MSDDGWTVGIYPGWQHQRLNAPFCPPWQRWSGRASNMAELMDRHAGPKLADLLELPPGERSAAMRNFRKEMDAWCGKTRYVQVWAWTRRGCERKLRKKLAEVA